MPGDAFAQEWPGAKRRGCSSRPPNWFFAREGRRGRPPFDDIEDLIALGRMWKGGPFGGPGWGPHRRGRGRARRGDVRLALLRLLAEEPRNGYQLMQAIEERSEGMWRPSPGSVYPTLAQLEDEELIHSADAEGTRRFEITAAGREHLESRADELDPWAAERGDTDNPLTELGPLVIQIGKATFQVASVGDPAQRGRARALLADTRRALYRILAEDGDEADPEEDPQ
ncbi:MAG: helix-turn-helix transcriptional regulator [Solirubrobacterales bacterium]|nr:helix-turn-helix transcriptional regulator [Solirubrobacterales bacterium]